MKYLIYCFSGTGNTKWTALSLMELLVSEGHDCVLQDIEEGMKDLNRSDLSCEIIIATPIYAADIPCIVKRFIQELNKNANYVKSNGIIILNTFAYVNGFGYFQAKKLFKGTGIWIKSYINIRLTNTAIKWDKVSAANNMPEWMKRRTNGTLERVFKRIDSGKRVIQGVSPVILGGPVIRKMLEKELRGTYKNMHVNNAKCTKCMKCVENCPVGSIIYENDRFVFMDTCEACMKCINLCPVNAISNKRLKD